MDGILEWIKRELLDSDNPVLGKPDSFKQGVAFFFLRYYRKRRNEMQRQELIKKESGTVQMTIQVPNEMAKRLKPIRYWLPAILELSLVGFRTLATETASEIIRFLSANPSPREVLDYHVSEHARERLRRLLTLNSAGMLGETEQLELDELQKVEHIIIMIKTKIAAQVQPKKQCH